MKNKLLFILLVPLFLIALALNVNALALDIHTIPEGITQVEPNELFTIEAEAFDEDGLVKLILYRSDGSSTQELENKDCNLDSECIVDRTLSESVEGTYYYIALAIDSEFHEITDSLTIIVEQDLGLNEPPILDPIGDKTICAGSLLEFIVTANDPDLGDVLTFSAINLPSGALFTQIDNNNALFSWQTAYPNDIGSYIVTFEVSDGILLDLETINIIVADCSCASNLPPVLDPIGNKQVNEGQLLEFTVTANDPNTADILEFYAVDLPQDAIFTQIDNNNALFSWTPDFDTVYHSSSLAKKILRLLGFKQLEEEFRVTFIVRDQCGTVDLETITITVFDVNRDPELELIPNQNICAGSLLEFTVMATDDDNDILIFSSSNLPDDSTFTQIDNNNALFSWQTDFGDVGRYRVTFIVSDNFGGSDSQFVLILVNDCKQDNQPILDPIGNKQVCATNLIEFTVTATDPNDDILTFTASPLPQGALFTQIDNNNALFSWKPDNDQIGIYTITFEVTDGTYTDSEIITMQVLAIQACSITKGNVDRVSVASVMVDPENVKAGDYIMIYTKTINTGNKDEDIELKLTIQDLGIIESKFFDLDEDKSTIKIFEIKIPKNANKGEYYIIVKAFNSKASDSKIMSFNIK